MLENLPDFVLIESDGSSFEFKYVWWYAWFPAIAGFLCSLILACIWVKKNKKITCGIALFVISILFLTLSLSFTLFFAKGIIDDDRAVWQCGFYGNKEIVVNSLSSIVEIEPHFVKLRMRLQDVNKQDYAEYLKLTAKDGSVVLLPVGGELSSSFVEVLIKHTELNKE